MTDEEHAHAIRDAVGALNLACEAAARAGLKIELDQGDHRVINNQFPSPFLVPYISRVQTL